MKMNKYVYTPTAFRRSRKAFTLVEILIVIGILVLLMGITTQMLGGVSDAQGRARAKSDMALIATGLEAFCNQYGGYPRLNAGSEEKFVGGEIYKCLVGRMMLKRQNDQIVMTEMGIQRRPFVDASKLKICDPADPVLVDVDPEKNGVYFGDPWNEPYLYFYDASTAVGNDTIGTWRSPGFILISKGPDRKETDVLSMYTTGIIPDYDDYISNQVNVDNLVHGRDD